LASSNRSGNSMFRKLLGETSGIVTGSDMKPFDSCFYQLIASGIRGEGISDSSTWIGKTHHPVILIESAKQYVSSGIVLVRNPLDSILSFMYLFQT